MTPAIPSRLPGASASPRLSVVIPVRNDASRLRRCLQSLAQSEFRDFETIVVDDASTDDTSKVAEAAGARVIRLPANVGPAAARNRGVEAAAAPLIHFIDADVCVHTDTLRRVADFFQAEPAFDAIFGSYDLDPSERNLISQYKNLFHRFVHQTSLHEASTFWTGCGAIRTNAFRQLGGFDTRTYARASIEDIELGARLRHAGGRIRLDPAVQVQHLKKWTLWRLVRCDFADRGVPWTRLILRCRHLPRDLNLRSSQRLSAALTVLLLALIMAGSYRTSLLPAIAVFAILVATVTDWITSSAGVGTRGGKFVLSMGAVLLTIASCFVLWRLPMWGGIAGLLVASIVLLNWEFYRFFQAHRGTAFAVLTIPLHLVYFTYSSVALATGIAFHILGGRETHSDAARIVATRDDLQLPPQTSTLGTTTQ